MGDPIKQDNPLMAVARGDFFLPLAKEFTDRRWLLAVASDVLILGGFLLAVLILSL